MPKKKNEEKKEVLVYSGPDLLRFGIRKFSVFSNGLSPNLEAAVSQCPSVNQLIVPISELNAVKAAIGVQGSKENRFYRKIEEFLRGE